MHCFLDNFRLAGFRVLRASQDLCVNVADCSCSVDIFGDRCNYMWILAWYLILVLCCIVRES
jgi:hypothetical protein